jgi:hypothetical protein
VVREKSPGLRKRHEHPTFCLPAADRPACRRQANTAKGRPPRRILLSQLGANFQGTVRNAKSKSKDAPPADF